MQIWEARSYEGKKSAVPLPVQIQSLADVSVQMDSAELTMKLPETPRGQGDPWGTGLFCPCGKFDWTDRGSNPGWAQIGKSVSWDFFLNQLNLLSPDINLFSSWLPFSADIWLFEFLGKFPKLRGQECFQ